MIFFRYFPDIFYDEWKKKINTIWYHTYVYALERQPLFGTVTYALEQQPLKEMDNKPL